jgi:hypothetical protein
MQINTYGTGTRTTLDPNSDPDQTCRHKKVDLFNFFLFLKGKVPVISYKTYYMEGTTSISLTIWGSGYFFSFDWCWPFLLLLLRLKLGKTTFLTFRRQKNHKSARSKRVFCQTKFPKFSQVSKK